ncbi:hypothetical protein K438DRAFT_1577186, partial [Mycena galopus ATCC 62051]
MLFDSLRCALTEIEVSLEESYVNDKKYSDEVINRWESLAFDLSNVVYPILTLPVEITSKIFTKFVEPEYPTEAVFPSSLQAPVLLLQICRTWRAIALANPLLWSTLHLRWKGHRHSYKTTVEFDDEIIQQWLTRASAVPLYLGL